MPILPRKIVQELQAFPAPMEGRYGFVRLDFNENTTGFPGAVTASMPDSSVCTYPEYSALIGKIGKHFDVSPQSLLLTNGSDEALMLVAQTFVEQGDVAVISRPCFVVMPHTLKLACAVFREVTVQSDFSFDVEGIERALPGAKVAMFASPENPTGAVLPPPIIKRWCETFPDTLFVIDEAYSEYAKISVITMIAELPNLLVLKTFSKAWGMAGLRLGVVFGQSPLLEYISRVKMPFSVNSAAIASASALMDRPDVVATAAQDTMARKMRIEGLVRSRGYTLVTGSANSFLLYLNQNAAKFESFARENGVLVRNRTDDLMLGYVRVSTGTDQEMIKFVDVLIDFESLYPRQNNSPAGLTQ